MIVVGITDNHEIELASGAIISIQELNNRIQYEADERAAGLEQIIDACEVANYKHLERIEVLEKYAKWYEQEYEPKANERIELLEQLCRDLYREGCYYWLLTNNDPPYARSAWCDDFCSRMDALGLLEVEQ